MHLFAANEMQQTTSNTHTTDRLHAPKRTGNRPAESDSAGACSCRFHGGLGKKRQNVAAPSHDHQENKGYEAKKARQNRRRERYADQRTAAAIYTSQTAPGSKSAGRGVTLCGWTQIADQETRLVRVDEAAGPRAFYRGLVSCGLRWVCPCCTIKKSEESREALNAALSVAREKGLRPVLLTLTARHKRSWGLRQFWDALSLAEKRMKTRRAWKGLNDRMPGGFAKAVELTHGRNGWHPHFHLVLMLEAGEGEGIELVESLRDEWLHQLNLVGLDGLSDAARKRAFDVRGADQAGDYITKWGAAEEMTLAEKKVGKSDGRNPWQLLRDARTAETEAERMKAGALWWQAVQVMSGVHQLRQSPKFRELVAEYEPPEEPGEKTPEVEVFSFGNAKFDRTWSHVRNKRLLMREAAEKGSIEGAGQAVADAMMGDMLDIDLWRDDIDIGPLIE